jgi:hypothetical protein
VIEVASAATSAALSARAGLSTRSTLTFTGCA